MSSDFGFSGRRSVVARFRIVACLFTVSIFLFSFYVGQAGARDHAKRVLIISTGSRFSIGFPMVEQSAVARLRQLYRGELDIFSEYMDVIRFPAQRYQRVFHDYLKDKYSDDIPDIIILIYAGNLTVASRILAQIFPGVPVVATGLTEEKLSPELLGSHITGIAQRADPQGTIETMLRLHPEVDRIVVVGGTAEIDKTVLDATRKAARPFSERIAFEYWNQRPMAEILKAAAALPPRTAILFTRMFRDGSGRAVISANAAQSIAEVANAPVYGLSDATLGTGAVGGSLSDVMTLGAAAGDVAYRILSGAPLSSIPFEIRTQGLPIFDWRALQRWNVPESRLPPNSVVRFRPIGFWQQYKWMIIIFLLICGIEAGLIGRLLWERRQRRLAQQNLERRLRLEQLVSELSGSFIQLPQDRIAGEIDDALGRVARLLDFDIAALSLFTHGGPEGRVAHLWKADGVPEIPANLTDQDFPWVAKQLAAGQVVSATSLDSFPPEARIDRATYERFGVQSTHNVPVMGGGEPIGVLGLCAVRRRREMPGDLLQAQRLLGEVFANALARWQAEAALRESESRFRMAVEASPNAVVMVDREGAIVLANSQAEQLFGYPREEFIGQPVEKLVPSGLRGGKGREMFARRKDGSDIEVEIGLSPIQRDGNVFVLTTVVDIRERKRAEAQLRGTREELAHASRRASMGELTTSIAHELNQPLAAILSNVEAGEMLLRTEPPALDEVREIFADIRYDNRRASDVIAGLRRLVRKQEIERAPLLFNQALEDVLRLLLIDAAHRKVTLKFEPAENLPLIFGDRVQLQQVVLNLVLNAMEAMTELPEGNRDVVVRCTASDVSATVSVCDSGPGIPSDRLPHLFEPFMTTKKEGMGMGLSIARTIIEAHEGRIWVENNADCGATFFFTLPLAQEAAL